MKTYVSLWQDLFNSSSNEKYFRQIGTKSQYIQFIFDKFFFPENRAVYNKSAVAFPLQQLLRERATMLRYTRIAYLVIY
jgi:hypothetical protein